MLEIMPFDGAPCSFGLTRAGRLSAIELIKNRPRKRSEGPVAVGALVLEQGSSAGETQEVSFFHCNGPDYYCCTFSPTASVNIVTKQ